VNHARRTLQGKADHPPAQGLFVLRSHRAIAFAIVARQCSSSRPIERGRPGPGLLAHVLVSKYGDHLPLYRLSQIFAREGVDLDRSTMADWVGRSTALLEPLADTIGRIVRCGPALFADDTPVEDAGPRQQEDQDGAGLDLCA
jgi:transposase